MKKLVLLIITFILIPAAQALEPDDFLSHIVHVDNTESGAGGIIVTIDDTDVILTNYKNVSFAIDYEDSKISFCIYEEADDEPDCSYEGEIVEINEDLDLAMIVPDLEDLGLNPIEISEESLEIGDEVTIPLFNQNFGEPMTLEFDTRNISGVTALNEDSAWFYNVNGYINRDDNEGPVFNSEGNFVGISHYLSYNESAGSVERREFGTIITNQAILWALENENIEFFSDVDPSTEHADAIAFLKSEEMIEGYSNGSFKPEKSINRAELLKIFVEGKGLSPDEDLYNNCFPDVESEWFAKYVCYAESQGWVEGYPDGNFLPGQNVNKAEAIKMLLEVFGEYVEILDYEAGTIFFDVDSNAWYATYLHSGKRYGILDPIDYQEDGYHYYHPSDDMTRGEISNNLYRLLKYHILEY